jgi:hypothetical protein
MEACQVSDEPGKSSVNLLFGFGYNDNRERVKTTVMNSATGLDDNTDANPLGR